MLTIRNQTDYPDHEVKALVRWAMKPFGVKETLVVVKYTKDNSPYSGTAYRGVPADMKPWPDSAWYGIKLRLGRPDAYPMTETFWRHGTEEDHHGEWPLFKFETWQEALVHLAAHEAQHNECYRENVPRRRVELRAEKAARKVLDKFLSGGFKMPVAQLATTTGRSTMSETPTNGLGDALRSAVAAIEGVELIDKPAYYTVKRGGKTLGYVNGKRKFRIDGPVKDGAREVRIITEESQIPAAVAFLAEAQPYDPEAKPDPKPTRKAKATA
jgi:hypothetical protein